ncbi:hypothetical protein ACQZV8_11890 [Magnetococcales bacterium HHB-1]
MLNRMNVAGRFRIRKNGEILQDWRRNLVVDSGKNWISDQIAGGTGVIGFIAIGTGTTAAIATDTALESELARESVTGLTTSGKVASFSANFAVGVGTGVITEAAVLADDGSTMISRIVFGAKTKDVTDALTLDWELEIV